MYWIHGGKFSSGQTNMYTGFKYMEHEVVVVEVQYRLHALGKFDKIKIKHFQCSKN